jgi:hypothetical protein
MLARFFSVKLSQYLYKRMARARCILCQSTCDDGCLLPISYLPPLDSELPVPLLV